MELDGNYWVLGIVVFLFVLSIKKYTDKEVLEEWVENFLETISPYGEIEEEGVIELEEVRDMITDFIVSNKEIFSKLKVNNE